VRSLRNAFGDDYVTADLQNPWKGDMMIAMSITDIPCSTESIDVVLCSHVLEHVPDDRRAMKEFHRILKKDGWGILLAPITAKSTLEDPSITEPSERLRIFGQEDHVRRYGLDYIDRLREAGFKVTTTSVSDLVTKDDALVMGLTNRESGEIYHCEKT
jgi:SAM-dependent methyltransferase